MRTRLVNRELNPLLVELPAKFADFPDHQRVAITEIVEQFDNGAKVVVCDAPTGSGKTVIAEAVRLMLDVDAAFVCHSKTLQDQFLREFDYASVLYGKANYRPHTPIMDATCDDCTGVNCAMCPSREVCPYQVAKMGTIRAPVAVVNSALWLAATITGSHWLSRRGLTIFDEADTLENVVMSQTEIVISPRMQTRYQIDPPARMMSGYGDWADMALQRLRTAYRQVRGESMKEQREKKRLGRLIAAVELLKTEQEEGRAWVYTGGAGSNRRTGEYISFKPVTVSSVGSTRIWPHSPKFLLMSGTVVSSGMLLSNLGYTENYATVLVPSQFHPSRRPVIVRPTQNMTKAGQQALGLTRLLDQIERILDVNPGRTLIHTVSYRLADEIAGRLVRRTARPVFTYAGAAGRADALAAYLATPNAVLVAASLDRGVDLYDDRCRTQIVCKTPFLSLGDKQTSSRLYSEGGKTWYNVEVARTVMQMVGRGVRHKDDYCTTYILDSHFLVWRRAWGHLFPDWFNRAIRVEAT